MPQHPTALRPRALKFAKVASITVGLVLGAVAGAWMPSVANAAESRAKARALPKNQPVENLERKRAVLPEASPEQLDAAQRVLMGRYVCEFDKTIVIDGNDTNRGYFNLRHGKEVWVTRPVLSSTGATRLEDVEGRILLVQIRTKSMVLDTASGRRVVDACVHEVQRAAELELRNSVATTPSLLGQ